MQPQSNRNLSLFVMCCCHAIQSPTDVRTNVAEIAINLTSAAEVGAYSAALPMRNMCTKSTKPASPLNNLRVRLT